MKRLALAALILVAPLSLAHARRKAAPTPTPTPRATSADQWTTVAYWYFNESTGRKNLIAADSHLDPFSGETVVTSYKEVADVTQTPQKRLFRSMEEAEAFKAGCETTPERWCAQWEIRPATEEERTEWDNWLLGQDEATRAAATADFRTTGQ